MDDSSSVSGLRSGRDCTVHQSGSEVELSGALNLCSGRSTVSTAPENPVRSTSYPVLSLADAIAAVPKIEAQYRSTKVDREIAAKMIGYSGLSGPANKSLAALAQ